MNRPDKSSKTSGKAGGLRKSLSNMLPLLPFFIFTVGFELVPIVLVAGSSLRSPSGGLTLQNYQHATVPLLARSFGNSIRLSITTAFLGVLLGSLIGYAIYTTRTGFFARATIALADVATNFGGAPLAFAFIITLGSTGVVTLVLAQYFGVSLYPSFRIYSITGLVLAYLYFQIPLMVLLIQPSLHGLKREWKEAAINLGASNLQYFRRIVLPILAPSLIGGFLLLFANSFGAYATAWTLTGPDINLVTVQIAALVRGEVQLEPGTADAMAMLSLIIMAVCVAGYQWTNARAGRWRR
jgi:putative spermidine/putrescine transport system permease protein